MHICVKRLAMPDVLPEGMFASTLSVFLFLYPLTIVPLFNNLAECNFPPLEHFQLDLSLSRPDICKASAPSTSPRFLMYAQISSYEALVTLRAGTGGTSFSLPSIDGLPICDASGVSACSALLPFSRQVLTAGTSA